MTQRPGLLTVDAVRGLPEDGKTYELLGGELIEREPPTIAHEKLLARLHKKLSKHVDDGDLGAVFRHPWPVELSKYDLVRPDIYLVTLARSGVVTPDAVRGAPELVVEVLSPASRERDLGEKLRLYAWAGVFEYWALDPEARIFAAKRKATQGYADLPVEPDRYRSDLLPDLVLDLAWLFDGIGD